MGADPGDNEVVRGAELAPPHAPKQYEPPPSLDPLVINLLFRYRSVLIVSFHFVLLLFSYWLAYVLRFEGFVPQPYIDAFIASLPLLLGCPPPTTPHYALHRASWRHPGMRDLHNPTHSHPLNTHA